MDRVTGKGGGRMDFKKLIYTVEDGIAIITMDYMKNLNAIDEQMADELLLAFRAAEKDEAVKVVILKGQEKAFSAGGDIGYFYDLIKRGGEVNMDGLISKVGTLADFMKKMSKIVITSVCGASAGAGVSLAIGGDFMICADNAKFILAFVNIGLVPDTGATYLLAKTIGTARTVQLAATGRPLSAAEAKEWGLAYEVVSPEELSGATMKLAAKIASGPLISYKNIKKQLYAAVYSDYKQWLDTVEVPTQRECSASLDFQEGCKAFMEKRKAEFKGK
ncbi:enoyl-CoA hydratase/isomerase family protein [Anaeroglobus geminatus F0357]|uniref:Enoyl-CoA hydratase/isomerase family protein n=2 Tax=Anaeroglobus TaxID=156454 RepID=G9YGL4_9FIRM|nr:enoyl-CoA hydratase/isomerase family protein [Anaeroglobus geminatus F0357]